MNRLRAYLKSGFRHCGRSACLLLPAIAMAQYGVATSFAGQAAHGPSYSETVLHQFTGFGKDGVYPLSTPLVRDSSGNLYGTTSFGGAYGLGSIFALTPTGQVKVLHSFSGKDGFEPFGQLALDASGFLYGTTYTGGATFVLGGQEGYGTIFKLATSGAGGKDGASRFTTLYSFTNAADGGYPTSGVILDAAGNLYGATYNAGTTGGGTLYEFQPTAGQPTVLYNFGANSSDGGFSLGLAMDAQGNIYGTDMLGGPYSSNCLQQSYVLDFGCGVVFKVDPSGNETLLHVFSGVSGDGGSPAGPPMLDSAGNLYGTTLVGGTGTCQSAAFPTGGCGTVFKIDAKGNYTVPYSFPGTGGHGAGPVGNLVMDSKGGLYGATEDGGKGNCVSGQGFGNSGGYYSFYPGCGVAFKLSAGTETILHKFSGLRDGGNPESGFIEDSTGNVYGTTYSGGDVNRCEVPYGCGTVFVLHK